MKRWGILIGLLAALLLGYVIAGPWIAIHGIRDAVSTGNASALARYVDFPPLRASLKAQLSDQLVRSAGVDAQSSLLGSIGLTLAGGVVGGMVDTMVTPVGLGALMEGHKVWRRASGGSPPSNAAPDRQHLLMRDTRYRFESASRFTATIDDDNGSEIVFVLTRERLRWKLSDIRLPL